MRAIAARRWDIEALTAELLHLLWRQTVMSNGAKREPEPLVIDRLVESAQPELVPAVRPRELALILGGTSG